MKRSSKAQSKSKNQSNDLKKANTKSQKQNSKKKQNKSKQAKENIQIQGQVANKRRNIPNDHIEFEKETLKKMNKEYLSENFEGEGQISTKSQLSQQDTPLQAKKISDAEILFGSNFQDSEPQQQLMSVKSKKSAKSSKSHKSTSPFNCSELRGLAIEEDENQEELEIMILRSGLELSRSSSKQGQEEYESLRHIQYHSSSGKKRSSKKASKDSTPCAQENALSKYFHETSNFNIIQEEEQKSNLNDSMMTEFFEQNGEENVEQSHEAFKKNIETLDLGMDFHDLKQTDTLQNEDKLVQQTAANLVDDSSCITQQHSLLDMSKNSQEQASLTVEEKRIRKLTNCILVEGQVIWEVEWNDQSPSDHSISFEYEDVLLSGFSEQFENMKNAYLKISQ